MMPARIVEAMKEIARRREEGERVHEILAEVAERHEVPLPEVQKRAEESWGIPLEMDRERHGAHFAAVEAAADLTMQARQFAMRVYEINLPYAREEKWWQVNWQKEIDDALSQIQLEDPALEVITKREFMIAAEHYEKLLQGARKR